KPRDGSSSIMDDTPMSARAPSTSVKLRSCATDAISRKFDFTISSRDPYDCKDCLACAIACSSWSIARTCPSGDVRSRIARVCPPAPRVASTKCPPGCGFRNCNASSSSTGVCESMHFSDSQFSQGLMIFVRKLLRSKLREESFVIPHVEIIQISEYDDLAV